MRRGQSSVEAVIAVLLLALLVSAAALAAGQCWQRAHAALGALHAAESGRRAQGVVEVLALAPLVAVAVLAFAAACAQLGAQGRVEAALAQAVAAAAAGGPAPAPPRGVRIVARGERLVAVAQAPFGEITVGAARS